jgi:hypothetical protein
MTADFAQWIRRYPEQNAVGILGGRERSRGSIGALMQRDVKMANQLENPEKSGVSPPLVPCFLDNFVPKCTEAMLQSRKSIVYVKLGECPHKLEVYVICMNGSAKDVDQDNKERIIPVGKVPYNVSLRRAIRSTSERNPIVVTFLHPEKILGDSGSGKERDVSIFISEPSCHSL